MSKKVPSALLDVANQLEISDSEQESTLATKTQILEYALRKSLRANSKTAKSVRNMEFGHFVL